MESESGRTSYRRDSPPGSFMRRMASGTADRLRPGSRTGLFSILAILLLSLTCALVGGLMYIQAREAASNLANLAPGKETEIIRAEAPAVVRQVQGLSNLEASKYTLEKILDAERTRRHVPDFLAGDRLIFVAHGEVVAGLDLSKVTEDDVHITDDTITLRLPQPQLLYSRIDNEKSYVYSRETGLFSSPDKDLESKVRAAAELEIREAALRDGILEEARENGEKTLRALLLSMGFTEVRFQAGSTD